MRLLFGSRIGKLAITAAGWAFLALYGDAYAQSAQRGQILARANCARCHSIDKITESPLKIAPPFRTLHKKYPVESLQESLAEGIVTGHQNMPEFRLERDQIGDFIAFLKTLE
jgi:mono/diheme cytochrome c family protein